VSTGVALATVQAAIAMLLRTRLHAALGIRRWTAATGVLIAAASLRDWHFQYLLQGEILYEIGSGWCLTECTYALHSRSLRLV
jgi:hypothetical protein